MTMCSSTAASEPAQAPAASPALWVCQYPAWHRLLSRHALRSTLIPLPPEFVEYLLADGVYLGEGNNAV